MRRTKTRKKKTSIAYEEEATGRYRFVVPVLPGSSLEDKTQQQM
jgi:hypothetical protein